MSVRSIILHLASFFCAAGLVCCARGEAPLVKFVSVPDFLNMDFQLNDPRLMDLTDARKAQLVAEINAGGPLASINPNVGNFVGTVENGYRGASQVLLEALAAENADFFTVSGDLLYTRWPKGTQLSQPWAAQHIRDQADIYYDGWIQNVATHSGFSLSDIYTVVGDHEIGDNDWGANKRPLIPTYREVYVDKVGNESTVAAGAYVNAPAGFEGRTYAVKRGNMLLVGLDQFETFTSAGAYTNDGSQIANVKLDVTGTQLQWLNNTLTQANNDPSIDHIVVLGHVPIAGQSTVKVQATSSALMNVTNETGALWQALAGHGVDLYMPGEVHAISMQLASDVLQVVTGTNIFQPTDAPGVNSIPFNGPPVDSEQNYVVVEVYPDRIDLTIKQIATKIWGIRGAGSDPLNDEPYKNREARVEIATADAGFQVTGTLSIDKSSGVPVYRNRSGLFLSAWTFNSPDDIGGTVDLNGDGEIDIEDVRAFFAGLHTDLSGLSAAEAFARGDMNGDFKNNHADFRIFKIGYELANGDDALAQALKRLPVPEPAALLLAAVAACWLAGARRRRSHRFPPGLLLGCIVTLAVTTTTPAAPVTGWIGVNASTGAPTDKLITGANTDSPVIGNGTNNSAGQVALYADISGTLDAAPDVSLANGHSIALSGLVTLEGITSNREQFRWGLFHEPTTPIDAAGWLGYFATNSNLPSDGGGGGNLRAKTAGNTEIFAANGTSVALQTAVDGDAFVSGAYQFTMRVSRFSNEAVIEASLTRTGWSQVWNVSTSLPNLVTFDFNRVGFLSGNNMSPDRVSFSGIDVVAGPIPALTLEVTTSGPEAGLMRMVNQLPGSVSMEYYEIRSAAGALNLSGWNSLDDQEGPDSPGMGWVEAGGSDGTVLSEGVVIGAPLVVAPGAALPLGDAFSAGAAEDLQFFVGLSDGSLLRAAIEYVESAATAGDFNKDGIVDAADYVLWRKTDGSPSNYNDWRMNFGVTAAAAGATASSAVPEPPALMLAIAVVPLVLVEKRNRKRLEHRSMCLPLVV